jgi:hypothetical protein
MPAAYTPRPPRDDSAADRRVLAIFGVVVVATGLALPRLAPGLGAGRDVAALALAASGALMVAFAWLIGRSANALVRSTGATIGAGLGLGAAVWAAAETGSAATAAALAAGVGAAVAVAVSAVGQAASRLRPAKIAVPARPRRRRS